MYCGKDIIIQITQEETKLGVNIKALLDLAKTAEEFDHFEDAKNYYIQVLEYDSDNMFAWLGRGYCEGMLSKSDSIDNDKIGEALSYFDKGFGIEGKEESIIQFLKKFPSEYINRAKRYLINIYNHWYQQCFTYREVRNIHDIHEKGLRFYHLLRCLDWIYILSNDDPDEQNKIKRGIALFVNTVYICKPWGDSEEDKRIFTKSALRISKLWNDPEIWAEVNKAKEKEDQIKQTRTKKKRWWF